MSEADSIEKKAFTLGGLDLSFDYWYFQHHLEPIDKSLRRFIASAYEVGDWMAIKNAVREIWSTCVWGVVLSGH